MKILFDHPSPFSLAHGGQQIQIEQTRLSLLKEGVDVEHLEWWNSHQKGDIIHFFGRPSSDYITLAQGKGYKVVLAELLTGTGSRSRRNLFLQKSCTNLFRKTLPTMFTTRMAWESYRLADACVALTGWEAELMSYLFGAPKNRVHVLPNGVEQSFFAASPQARGPWLVCTATIAERKRVLELAEAAVLAKTPLWIIGTPYSAQDAYGQKFIAFVKQHPQMIRYEGGIRDRAQLAQAYRAGRGFVLLSAMETRSISAEEAAACECSLLLSDLPWARSVFGETAQYCPLASVATTAKHLRQFYDQAPSLPKPPPPATWPEVAVQLKQIYAVLLSGRLNAGESFKTSS